MAISRVEVVDYLANMTVLELSTLIKELEEKFGVSAAAPMAVARRCRGWRPRRRRRPRSRPNSTWF